MIGSMSYEQIMDRLGASLHGVSVSFDRVSTDTRTLQPGDLFIALDGPRFHGQSFVQQAIDAGAVGVMLSHKPVESVSALIVPDTREALGELGAINRGRFEGELLAITGSAGKTTVKEMATSILRQSQNVLATQGNFNNEIGVPLTLLRIDATHGIAVMELGASSIGEIAYSAALVRPDVAVITNAVDAHIEGFGSLNNIVQAKGEIIDALDENGIVVINIDDLNAYKWIERAGERARLSFSLRESSGADYYAKNCRCNASGAYRFQLESPAGAVEIQLPHLGMHNVSNALAAAAGAMAVGAGLADVKVGLEQAVPVSGRLITCRGRRGAVVIDDSYNANPESLQAAVDVLCQCDGQKILVMGDMAELGDESLAAHQKSGRYAREHGVDLLLTVGNLSAHAAREFGARACAYENREALILALQHLLNTETTVLVKGSRSSRMEDVVRAITSEEKQ